MFLVGGGAIAAIVIGALLVILLIAYISCLNGLRRLTVKCDEALSDIDVALTKRYDTLTKMLDTVKGYNKHEAETLAKVIELRNGANVKSLTPAEKVQLDQNMAQVASRLNVVVEQYPDLKASDLFKNLQNAIADVEDHLQAARRTFNANVSALKQKVVTFPTSIVAKMGHIEVPPMFKAEEEKKKDVKMEF